MSNDITVEVAFALPTEQFLHKVSLPAESTVADAIRLSGLNTRFATIDLDRLEVGVWGQECHSNRQLKSGDRVEVYRPLEIDPRETRRLLAQLGKTMGHASDA